MRVSVAHLAFGLLAWLPACRNQAFESCNEQAPVSCLGDASEGAVAASATTADDANANQGSPPAAPSSVATPTNSPSSTPAGLASQHASPDDTGLASTGRDAGGAATHDDPIPVTPPPVGSIDPQSASASAVSEPGDPSMGATAPVSTYGDSLITNGDFSDGKDFWSLERISGGGFTSEFTNDTLCVSGRGSTRVIVGWPERAEDSVALPQGRYQFSFRVRGRGVHLWAKVGHAYEPYDILFEREWTSEQVGWHEAMYEFDLDGDDAAGVAFNIDLDLGADSLCLDDVALRRAITHDASAP